MPNKYRVVSCSKYKRVLKKARKNMTEQEHLTLGSAIKSLRKKGTVPQDLDLHKAHGALSDVWECHIADDLLLTYTRDRSEKVIVLRFLGSHRDTYRMHY